MLPHTITYNTVGVYTVSLMITKGKDVETEVKDGYVVVGNQMIITSIVGNILIIHVTLQVKHIL